MVKGSRPVYVPTNSIRGRILRNLPFLIFLSVAFIIGSLDIYPDIKIVYDVLKYHIALKDILKCHSVSNDDCHSLDKYPQFRKELQADKD